MGGKREVGREGGMGRYLHDVLVLSEEFVPLVVVAAGIGKVADVEDEREGRARGRAGGRGGEGLEQEARGVKRGHLEDGKGRRDGRMAREGMSINAATAKHAKQRSSRNLFPVHPPYLPTSLLTSSPPMFVLPSSSAVPISPNTAKV